MNIYQGTNRRQVGGGIWSTITRGIRPIIFNLLKTLKPHAANAANRVAQSAAKVGTEMAVDAIQGKFNKSRLKQSMKREGTQLTNDAFSAIKRKLDNAQTGSGNKRRRLNPQRQSVKMKVKQHRKRKVPQKSKTKRSKPKRNIKRKSKVNKRKKSRGIRKRKTKRQSVTRRLKDIFN